MMGDEGEFDFLAERELHHPSSVSQSHLNWRLTLGYLDKTELLYNQTISK